MLAVLIATMLSASAAGYNARQEALRAGIEKDLKDRGYSVERRDDGLKFMVGGEPYFIEIDEESADPMFVRLARYIKFDDNFKRSDVMKQLNNYNTTYAVKTFCKEKNLIVAADMFVTEPGQFTSVFSDLFSLLNSVIKSTQK